MYHYNVDNIFIVGPAVEVSITLTARLATAVAIILTRYLRSAPVFVIPHVVADKYRALGG